MERKKSLIEKAREDGLKRLKRQMTYKGKRTAEKAKHYRDPSSLLWVWEFSKKAVLICFSFYVVIQVYSMVVMWKFLDFSQLGTLIDSSKELTRDCVFGYLIKAGLENIGKIWFSNFGGRQQDDDDTPAG